MPLFEILDWVDTPLGTLYLRRRELLHRPGKVVVEVTLADELLMSSLNTRSEEELARAALSWRGGTDQGLRVLVGGQGLGYTAWAALEDPRVATVEVVEHLPEVVAWARDGKIPLAPELARAEAAGRLAFRQGDVYALLLAPATETWDLILIDVDHTPTEHLGPTSAPFYTPSGLERVQAHLAPGGVLAVWSAGDDEEFAATLAASFERSERVRVVWENELIDQGVEVEDVLFLGG